MRRRTRGWLTSIAFTAVVSTALLTWALLAWAEPPAQRLAPGAGCVSGTASPARAARISSALRGALLRLAASDADAARLSPQPWQRSGFCFGGDSALHEPTLHEPPAVVLDARLDDLQAAARAAHLLLHAWVAPPWSADTRTGCDAKLRAALDAEARAHALERAVAAVLHSRVAAERSPRELAAAYAERCQRERR
jgi:hypothetical protein